MDTVPKHFQPGPYEYHQELEISIDDVSNTGFGVGRDNGWVIMVPFCLRGERVRVRVFRNHSNYSEADLIEVVESAPERVTPECELFGTCGGCQYQHISYAQQLLEKQQQLQASFTRLGGFSIDIPDVKPSPRPFNYRSKITPHYPSRKGEHFPIGFLQQGSRRKIVDVPQCPIATQEINAVLPDVRSEIWRTKQTKRHGGTVLLRHSQEGVTTRSKDSVTEMIGDLQLHFRAGDFFQNNPFLLPELVHYVIEQAQGDGVQYLVDAYCGVGLFSLAAAKDFSSVVGIEVNSRAVASAEHNAEINAFDNCQFVLGEAEAIFAEITLPGEQTTVIMDPPRSGANQRFIEQLLAYAPAKVIYVSCEPTTQARDLKRICESGEYQIESVQPFDMFPQTRHVENVVTLVRNPSR